MTTKPTPLAGPDYPRTPTEFAELFPDEEACARFVERLRWPDGFVCPKCERAGTPWKTARGRLCRHCRSRVSLTAGTVLERTHKPLSQWLSVAWELSAHSGGLNARAVQRLLGLGSYQTAWTWLHKMRRAMAEPDTPLFGPVAAGRLRLPLRGGAAAGGRGRRVAHVGVLVECVGRRRIGRVRLEALRRRGAGVPTAFVARHLPAGVPLADASEGAFAVQRVGTILERWMLDTYQGGVSEDHIAHYLDEFAFRFNSRRAASRGIRFRSLMTQALQTETVTARELFASGAGVEPRGASTVGDGAP